MRNCKAGPKIWNSEGPPYSQKYFETKKNKVGVLTFPNFKTYYKATVITQRDTDTRIGI